MWRKKLYLLIILVSFYICIMVNYPSETLKSLGYNNLLEFYAEKVSTRADCKIIYNPGLRKLDFPLDKVIVQAIIPGRSKNYSNIIDQMLADKCGAIVECSALDSWHSSGNGLKYLQKIRESAYRVVIFDGGHHLPTIGLEPDIIIIPQIAGYAVHSYMLDGMKVSKVLSLAREVCSPSVIVTVPRWALVKNEKSLIDITQKILLSSNYTDISREPSEPLAERRISKYGGVIFAYINKDYSNDIHLFLKRLNSLGINNINKICLAFDYNYISKEEAEAFLTIIHENTKIPVERVNEPVKVTGVFWGER